MLDDSVVASVRKISSAPASLKGKESSPSLRHYFCVSLFPVLFAFHFSCGSHKCSEMVKPCIPGFASCQAVLSEESQMCASSVGSNKH